MTGSYQEVLDALYRAFAAHRRPTSLRACACCWEGSPVPGSPGVVLAPVPGADRPLRTLEAEVVGRVAAKVPHTGGSPAVLLHYLPRLLELAAEDRLCHPDVELAFGRVALAGGPLAGWPEPERTALRCFFAAFWSRRLAAGAEDPNPDIDGSLCALGLATGDVTPYLEEWLRFEHRLAAQHLLAFLERNVGGRWPRAGCSTPSGARRRASRPASPSSSAGCGRPPPSPPSPTRSTAPATTRRPRRSTTPTASSRGWAPGRLGPTRLGGRAPWHCIRKV